MAMQEVCVVDIDEFLFCYSPHLFDQSNQAVAEVGVGVSLAGGLVAVASATAGDRVGEPSDCFPSVLSGSLLALGRAAIGGSGCRI